jgi:phage shock protein PspC (stress-responsive transcriptional regulator)
MKKLFRSKTNKKIAGICGGIGEITNTDPTIIRLIVLVLGLVTGVVPFLIGYLIAWWIVPVAGQN